MSNQALFVVLVVAALAWPYHSAFLDYVFSVVVDSLLVTPVFLPLYCLSFALLIHLVLQLLLVLIFQLQVPLIL